MANLKKASEETHELVTKIAQEIGLTNTVEFQTFSINKGKEIVKLKRADEIAQINANKEPLVCVIVYEDAFYRLDEKTQYLLIRTELDKVFYDFEKDKLTISTPMISVPLSSYQKYGNPIIQIAESALLTIQQIEDERKALKEMQKANKKKKNG